MNFQIPIYIVNYNSSKLILNTLFCLDKITKNQYKSIIRYPNSELKDFQNLKISNKQKI